MKNWLLFFMCCLLMTSCAAWAEEQAVVYFHDGSMVMLPVEIAGDAARLKEYCDKYFPGRGYSFDIAAGQYDAILSEVWTKAQYGENSMAAGVKLVKLGLHECDVTMQGEALTVPAQYLQFGENKDGDHRLGVVYAPRTGEASLREEEGGSAKLIAQAKSGRIVAVMQYDGGTYTRILYDGEEGYIRTDCLNFHSGERAPMGMGTIHIKGAVDGKKTVTMYTEESTSKAKVTTLKTGTAVKVYEHAGSWYAVEADGWYGYVQDQYVNME